MTNTTTGPSDPREPDLEPEEAEDEPHVLARLAEFLTRATPMWATIVALVAASYGPLVTHLQTADRTTQACRQRNGSFEALRVQSIRSANALADFLSQVEVDQAVIDQFVASQYAAIPTAEKTDIDCNRNGKLDDGDYAKPRTVLSDLTGAVPGEIPTTTSTST